MLSRREVLAGMAGAFVASSTPSWAQQQPKMLRVGFAGIQPRAAPNYVAFVKRMAELGYREGRNFTFDYIQASGLQAYEAAYRELAARKVDIMLTAGSEPGLRAARAAAGAVPIAFLAIDFDPIDKGYVASLVRPGGIITEILVRQLELASKRVEILREAMPKARRLGLVWDAASRDQAAAAADAGKEFGFGPRLIEVTGEPPDYAAALQPMQDASGEPVVIPASPIFLRDRDAIARALTEKNIPSIAAFRDNAEAGALMSYGIDLVGLFADIADFVDRIAKGTHPADMPIEQSTRFHMAINLKSAAILGISLPVSFTARANEVFE